MKKFRKITIAVLMASMVLALGACGRSNTPTAVVEKQMQQVSMVLKIQWDAVFSNLGRMPYPRSCSSTNPSLFLRSTSHRIL